MSPHVPGKEALRAKRPGAPDPHILSGPLSGEETGTPPGGFGAVTCPQVAARARGRDASPGRLAHLPHSMRYTKVRSTVEPEVTFDGLYC